MEDAANLRPLAPVCPASLDRDQAGAASGLCDQVAIAVRAVVAWAAGDRDWVMEEIQIQLSDEFGLVSMHTSILAWRRQAIVTIRLIR